MRVTTAKLIKRFLEFLMGNNCTLPCRSAPNELPTCAKSPSHEQFHSRDVTAVVGYKKRHGLAIGIVRLTAEDVIGGFLPHTSLMGTSVSRYHRHRFPTEIISHCAWLYFRFSLSLRDVEEMMASRVVSLTYETVREWCLEFGQIHANGLRRTSPRPGDQWLLDEVFLKINGRLHYLWWAVDQDWGEAICVEAIVN